MKKNLKQKGDLGSRTIILSLKEAIQIISFIVTVVFAVGVAVSGYRILKDGFEDMKDANKNLNDKVNGLKEKQIEIETHLLIIQKQIDNINEKLN